MPLLIWLDSFEGATFWRVLAKVWSADDEGENRIVEADISEDRTTGTIDQGVSAAEEFGVQGVMAIWKTVGSVSSSPSGDSTWPSRHVRKTRRTGEERTESRARCEWQDPKNLRTLLTSMTVRKQLPEQIIRYSTNIPFHMVG